MKKYLILPRYQFAAFYQFGNLFVKSHELINAETDDSKKIEDCFSRLKKMPFFEYDDEYIILKIDIDTDQNEEFNVTIDHVTEFIALSNQAKLSIESKIDPRIQVIHVSWAEKVLNKIESFYTEVLIEKGIEAIWKISGFKEHWKKEPFFSESLFNDLIIGVNERNFVKSLDKVQHSIITQAIVYDRIDSFPEGKDGYLFDIFEILCNHLQKGYQFKNTELFSWIFDKHVDGQINCWLVFSNDTSFEKLSNIRSTLKSKLPKGKIRWENAIAWFLSQKESIQKIGHFDATTFKSELFNGLDEFVNERKAAVIMLGAFFGYKYFYDELYNVLKLEFFKKNENSKILATPKIDVIKTDIDKQSDGKKEASKKNKPTILKEANKVGNKQKKITKSINKKNKTPEDTEIPFEVTRITEP